MDRAISESELKAERRKRWATIAAVVAAVLLGIIAFRHLISPGVDGDQLRLATVERGPMQASIELDGIAVPRSERVVSAEFDTRLVEVLAFPGSHVEEGDPLLRLDVRALDLIVADLSERLTLKQNERTSRKLALETSLSGLESTRALRLIDLQSRQARHERLNQLASIGAISKGDLLEADLDVKRTETEIRQLGSQIAQARRSHDAELDKIDIETQILANQLAEQKRLSSQAILSAPRSGLVTWVFEQAGASIATGSPIARIADISQFRIEATASDYYANQIAESQLAHIDVGDQRLAGRLTHVRPSVEAGQIRLTLDLEDPSAAPLRPNRRVSVRLVTVSANDTLYVRQGPGLPGRGERAVYVIEGDVARRQSAIFGFANRDHIQVIEGLAQGDRLIISDTRTFDHSDTLRIR